MNFLLVIASVLGGWTLLLLVSGEHLRRVQGIRSAIVAAERERERLKREAEIPIEVS